MSCSSTLWMGDVEPYMDEAFITNAFTARDETIVGVKTIRSKRSGTIASYCFVEFPEGDAAHKAMLKLNGKIIPGAMPLKRFKLNLASYGREHLLTPEYSLFVADLTEDVDDLAVYTIFSKRYKSCRSAKVVLDPDGASRGYGFVRFTEEADQTRALNEMSGFVGLGKKAIRVSLAIPKRSIRQDGTATYNQDYYNQYYYGTGGYDYSAWGNSYYYPPGSGYTGHQHNYNQQQDIDDERLEDPELEIDVAAANQEFMERSEEFYTALEGSRWHPLDNVLSPIIAAVK